MTLALLLKILLIEIGIQYAIIGILFACNGQIGLAIAYIAYAVSNVGLCWGVKPK
jgi:hypothetical protein